MAGPSSPKLHIGMLLFPRFARLDVTAPYEVFSRLPHTIVHLMSPTMAPVESQHGLPIAPSITFADAPPCDVLFVPGGPGAEQMMDDQPLLECLRDRGGRARYVTSVCAGSLLLGAAGLLRGYRATTHRMHMERLPLFGAEPVHQRVVVDRNRITGRGVTGSLRFGFAVASELFGRGTFVGTGARNFREEPLSQRLADTM